MNELFFLKSVPKRFITYSEKKVWKFTRKLQYRYTGPHRIIEVKNPVVYKAMVNGKEKMGHLSKIKRDPAIIKRFDIYEDDIID